MSMRHSISHGLPNAPRKNLAAALDRSERAHKQVVSASNSDVFKPIIGAFISAALRGAGLENKEATYLMGYGENMAPLSNWIAGRENPQFSRLWALGKKFRRCLIVAMADACDDDAISVNTVVTVRDMKGRST